MKTQGAKRVVAILFCLLLLPWFMFPASAFAETGDVSADLLVGESSALTTAEGATETDATVDNRGTIEVGTWQELCHAAQGFAPSSGMPPIVPITAKTIKLTNDVVCPDNQSRVWVLREVAIDLNGHKMDRHRSERGDSGYVIEVVDGANLTIEDGSVGQKGTITGGWAKSGGGIYVHEGGNLNLNGGAITGNKATAEGGGIYVAGTMNMAGGTISENEASDDGGGIFVKKGGKLVFDGGAISGNTAGGDGGGVSVHGALTASSSASAVLVGGTTGTIEANSANETGGGIYVEKTGSLNLFNAKISSNTASDDGGGLNVHLDTDSFGYIRNCVITNNNTSGSGGGLRMTQEGGTLRVQGTTIDSNKASEDGGGIYARQGKVVIGTYYTHLSPRPGDVGTEIRSSISKNVAGAGGGGVNVKGGAIFEATDVSIKGNAAITEEGGGIKNCGTATLSNCSVTGNTANTDGGGVYSDETLEISGDTTICENKAEGLGGGVYINKDAEKTSIEGSLQVTDNSSRFGGNVYLRGKQKLTCTGSLSGSMIGVDLESVTGIFTENYNEYHNTYHSETLSDLFTVAEGCYLGFEGGEAAITSNWGVVEAEIESLSSGKTYTLWTSCAATPSDGKIEISGNKKITVDLNGYTLNRNCSSKTDSGHVFQVNSGSTLTIIDSSATESSPGYGKITGGWSGYGGGIYVYGGGTLEICGGTITGNKATEYGGGVYLKDDATLKLSETGAINGNRADKRGGGVYAGVEAVVTVQGRPVVQDNYASLLGNNIYLPDFLFVTGALEEGAQIGVTRKADWGVFTRLYFEDNSEKDPSLFFTSDEDFQVVKENGEAALRGDNFGATDDEEPFIDWNDQMKADTDALTSRNWMAGISGERYLNEINLPGSHDAGMNKIQDIGNALDATSTLGSLGGYRIGANMAKTQTTYIDEQLNNGARIFDLRLTNQKKVKTTLLGIDAYKWSDDNKNAWVCHGSDGRFGCYLACDRDGNLLSFVEVIGWVEKFLERHPTETVILHIRPQMGDSDKVYKRVKSALDEYAVQRDNDSTHEPFLYREPGSSSPFAKYTHMPQLKDCRGKIVLWFEYGGGVEDDDHNPPKEVCGGFTVEKENGACGNKYSDPTDHSKTASDQVDSITNSYNSMNDGSVRLPDSADTNCDFLWHWELNCTGEEDGLYYGAEIVAGLNPVDLAHYVNPSLVGDGKLFGPQIAGQYIGWVKMDAFGAKYAEAIWRTNFFDGQQYCTVTVESGVDDPRFPTQTYKLLKGTTIVIPDNIYLNDHPQAGATFKGWMGPGSSEPLQKGTAYEVNQDVTFTASWAGVKYDVIYKVVGGTWADGSTEDKTEAVASGSKPASVPTDMDASPGYRGGKWDADPTGTITRPMTFTYTFEVIPEYTVRFDPNVPANASTVCTGSMDDQGFKYLERKALNGNEYTLPGYDFTCWKMKADGTEKLYSDKEEVEKLSEDGGTVTLYAQWSPKKYSITYLSNDDNGSSHSQEAFFDQTDKLHSYSDESFGWSSAGKTLHGWSTSTLGIGSFYEDGEGFCNLCGAPNADGNLTDVTLFADWVQNGQIVATVTKNGVPQGGLASRLSLTRGGAEFDIPVTDKDHAGTYVFNPTGITVGGNPAQLPEGKYVLRFEAPGYPSASAEITYGGDSAASVVFDYYTVSLSKDPVHASFIDEVEISGGAADPSAPDVVVALDGDKLGIKTDVSAGYRFERYIAAGVTPIWGEGGSSNAEQTIEVQGQADITALVAPIKYSVAVVGGTADKTTAVVGETVAIKAGAPESGKAFVQWEQIDGVAFENESSVETTFSMPAKDVTATAVCAPIVIDAIKDKVYTGSAIEPADEVKVSLEGVDVNLTTDDYEVSFKDNVNAGDAKAIVTMKSPFAESATSTFKIVPADISEAVVTAANQRYDGTERKPMPKVTWKDKVLIKDWDYKVIAYADNVHAGSASVIVKGNGNFKNEATGAFKVKSKPVTIKVNDASKAQGQKDPAFTGTVEGLVASGDLGKIRYVRTNSAEDVGVYEGVLSATYARNPDYNVTVREGDFTIEPLYTVKFVNWDGAVLQSSGVARGEMPVYAGKTPKKAATAKLAYTFKGWSPAIKEVTGEATYKATYTPRARKYAPPAPRMKAEGEDGLSVAWSKVPGADGYDVYFSRCGHGGKRTAVKKVATLEGADATSWARTGLKAHRAYKVRIRAYVMEGDEKVYVISSPTLHLYTAGGTATRTNAKGVKVNRKKVALSKGKAFKLKAKARKLDKSKKLMPKSHAARVRYLSSDTSVATVSPKGKITGRSKGECIIYVYAHSGIYKKVKVTVK